MAQKAGSTSKKVAAPKGTRDVYPEDMLRRRYIAKVWRDTAIRHGFEEIDGPTFEQSELYAVKSGEGILGELFQSFSGKDPAEVERVRETGRGPFAMRPEFTPTLARMYAARAAQLSKPVKWFSIGPYFRAERPQRGRLREFLQWNCDVVGLPGEGDESKPAADAEAIEVGADALHGFGVDLTIALNDRFVVERLIGAMGCEVDAGFALLDKRAKMDEAKFAEEAGAIGFDVPRFDAAMGAAASVSLPVVNALMDATRGVTKRDSSIVRGLAYYTGTVFEVIAEGERAVAGGGRYDGLVELLGGPATPAVGFAMGDVVLGLLLEEKGLMPEGAALMDAVSGPSASVRPDAFVFTPDEGRDGDVRRLVAGLRRGVESEAWLAREDRKPWDADRYAGHDGVRPLHARRSYKATRNVGKLLKEAAGCFARFAVIVEGDGWATVKELGSGEERKGIELDAVAGLVAGSGGR